jgi:hypothetical protein
MTDIIIPNNWTLLSGLIVNVSEGETWVLQNKSGGSFLYKKSENTPNDNDNNGFIFTAGSEKLLQINDSSDLSYYVKNVGTAQSILYAELKTE